jgi:peptidyl-prolyl cis-trans isomerase A (cyclophilin A)
MRPAVIMLASALVASVAAACAGGGNARTTTPAKHPEALLHPARLAKKAPAVFKVRFRTTKGDFVVTVRRTLAPNGADRFYTLAKAGFFDGVKFFRVVPGFVVQFGISPYPTVSAAWRDATLPDDPVKGHNARRAVSFASAGPRSRTTQLFVNLADNRSLDKLGFAPIGTVTSGMAVVDKLYSGYGEQPTSKQTEMQLLGNAWLQKHYPKLDSIESATVTR